MEMEKIWSDVNMEQVWKNSNRINDIIEKIKPEDYEDKVEELEELEELEDECEMVKPLDLLEYEVKLENKL